MLGFAWDGWNRYPKIFQKMVIAWWVSKKHLKLTLSKSNIYRYYWFIPSFRPRFFSYSLHWYVDTIRHPRSQGASCCINASHIHGWDVDCSPMINIHDRQWDGNNPCVSKLRSPQKCDTLVFKQKFICSPHHWCWDFPATLFYIDQIYLYIDLRWIKNITKISVSICVCKYLFIQKKISFFPSSFNSPSWGTTSWPKSGTLELELPMTNNQGMRGDDWELQVQWVVGFSLVDFSCD